MYPPGPVWRQLITPGAGVDARDRPCCGELDVSDVSRAVRDVVVEFTTRRPCDAWPARERAVRRI